MKTLYRKNIRRLGVLSGAMILTLVLGCSAEPSVPGGDEIRSDKQRITAPVTSPTEVSAQVEGNSAFAFDLFQQVRSKDENLFFSPYSMSIALAMLQAGAKGETEQQIAAVMHYLADQTKLHPVFNWLDLELNSRGQGKLAADGKAFRLNVVNAIWGQQDFDFLPSFLDQLALNYGAGLRVLDFIADPEISRQTINAWVEQETEERIKDLLPEGVITKLTRLVLTNAIYFNAAWSTAFQEDSTSEGAFILEDGSSVNVPLMRGKVGSRFYSESGLRAAAIPYDGEELSMVIMIPDQVDLQTFEATLTGAKIQAVIQGLQHQEVNVTLPKFEFGATLGLKPLLIKMGMVDAFTPYVADLSGINGAKNGGDEDLYVSDVLHKSFVKVNEAGTEAAAATAVVLNVATAVMPDPEALVVDQPFVFFIYDHATEAILFVGRVLDPR